jgi:uncharacterized membrane protein
MTLLLVLDGLNSRCIRLIASNTSVLIVALKKKKINNNTHSALVTMHFQMVQVLLSSGKFVSTFGATEMLLKIVLFFVCFIFFNRVTNLSTLQTNTLVWKMLS